MKPASPSSPSSVPGPAKANMPGSAGLGHRHEPALEQRRHRRRVAHGFVSGRVPGGQRDAPARAQDAARLAQRRRRVGHQHVAPAAQHARRRWRCRGRSTRRRRRGTRRCRGRAAARAGAPPRAWARRSRVEISVPPGAMSSAARKPVSPGPAASSSTVCPGCGLIASTSQAETGIAACCSSSARSDQPAAARDHRSRLAWRYSVGLVMRAPG